MDVNFGDSRVEAAMQILSDEMKSQLRNEVEASSKKEQAEILSNMQGKITDKVKALLADIQDRVTKGEKGTQWKTLVDKVRHIVEVLPAYNVTENPELDKMIASVKENFGTLNEDGLKDSVTVRAATVEKANQMVDSFANLF